VFPKEASRDRKTLTRKLKREKDKVLYTKRSETLKEKEKKKERRLALSLPCHNIVKCHEIRSDQIPCYPCTALPELKKEKKNRQYIRKKSKVHIHLHISGTESRNSPGRAMPTQRSHEDHHTETPLVNTITPSPLLPQTSRSSPNPDVI
jgi:hypothetical protein